MFNSHNDVVRIEETKGQLRASTNTFNFNSDARAQRRKEVLEIFQEQLVNVFILTFHCGQMIVLLV